MTSTLASVEMDQLWSAFTLIESWTAIASSPDARFVSRAWRDGRGRSGVRTVDLETGEESSWDLVGRTVVSIACSSLCDVVVVTIDDDTLTQRLMAYRADPAIMVPLGPGRWTLSPDGYGAWVATCCHDKSAPVLLVSNDGNIARLAIDGFTVTSVVGVHRGFAWVNAYEGDAAGDVRLTSIDLSTGQLRRCTSGLLGVLLGHAHLVTTTTSDPETVQIHTLAESSDDVCDDHARSVSLHDLRGALTVCAISPAGDQLLLGMWEGLDDSSWLVDVATGRADRLSDEVTAFGGFAMFHRGDPCWLAISPSGALEIRRRRSGSDLSSHLDSFAAVLTKAGVPWNNVVDLMRTPTAGGSIIIESLVLAPAAHEREDLLVVMLHGGPRARWSRKYDQTLQLFVGAGFRVIAPNTRGSASDDRAFEQALQGQWGALDQDDLAAVLADLRDEYPQARILLVGVSYGAYQAFQATLAEPGALAGVILAAGFPSPERLFAEGTAGTRRSLSNQQAIPSVWARGSSPHAARGLPVWVVHGQADPLVPSELGEEMAGHLRRAGADVEVTIVPGAGHQVLDADEGLHDRLLRFAQRTAAGYPGGGKGR